MTFSCEYLMSSTDFFNLAIPPKHFPLSAKKWLEDQNYTYFENYSKFLPWSVCLQTPALLLVWSILLWMSFTCNKVRSKHSISKNKPKNRDNENSFCNSLNMVVFLEYTRHADQNYQLLSRCGLQKLKKFNLKSVCFLGKTFSSTM